MTELQYNTGKDPVAQMRDFLKRSRKAFSNDVQLQVRHLEAMAPGKWWSTFMAADPNNRVLRRAKRLNIDCNQEISTYADLVVSPMSQSPWAIKLDDPEHNEIQKAIDKFEAYLDSKEQYLRAATRGVLVGRGWLNFHLEDGNPRLEFIQNQSTVWADADSRKADNSDARETAVVNWVPASKYPGVPRLQEIGSDVDDWAIYGTEEGSSGSITDAYYYRKEDDGSVWCHHIVGSELQESTKLPFSIIPILAISGYNEYSSNKANQFSGICQRTWDIQLLKNLAMSQLADRQNRSVKAKVAMSDKAVKGLEGAVKAALNCETPLLMYREGAAAPTILNETQNYSDIESILTMCRTAMDNAIGVTLASELPIEKTAAEVLVREEKRITSVNTIYSHAQMLFHSMAKLLMEAITGEVLPYSLINGPEAISENYKLRKDVAALSTFYEGDETMKAVLGYKVAQSSGDQDLITMVRMNLPATVKLPDDNILDMLREATEATQVAEELSERNAELEQQLNEANASVQSLQSAIDSSKQSFQLQVAQMKLDAQQKALDYQAKIAELEAKIRSMEMGNAKTAAETEKITAEAEGQEIENAKAVMPDEVVVVEGV